MTYKIEVAPAAARALRKLPSDVRRSVERRILPLRDDPRPPQCRQLAGRPGQWRIRVGDYRVIYRIEDSVLVVEVIAVAHRREVYR